VTVVTAGRAGRRYLLLIERRDENGDTDMNWTHKIATLALAAALLLPGALATLNQAAQIVA
jgi:hypothetical protein